MPAGLGMEEGMGMVRGGDNGPSLGRGMGVGSTDENATATGGMQHGGMNMTEADVSKDANSVPGFPQDAFMEGPAMAMDKMVDKPENHGLRPGWSGFMQGMMTFVRVLEPEKYDEIMRMKAKA